MIKSRRLMFVVPLMLAWLPVWHAAGAHGQSAPVEPSLIRGGNLTIEAFDDGSYALRSTEIPGDVLRAEVEADTAAGMIKSSQYPKHLKSIAPFSDALGSGHLMTVTHTGLPSTPDLVCEFRVYDDQPWGDIRVTVRNTTGNPIEIHAIHVLKTEAGEVLNLNGPASVDRVLSDRYDEGSERLMDLGEPANGLHLGFGSQLIYNRKSRMSLFMGALSADRMVTAFHLHSTTGSDAHLLSYDVTDAGTNEAEAVEEGLSSNAFPQANIVPFRLQVPAGESLGSERLMLEIGSDYHAQLENYGRAIRMLYKPPVSIPSPIGWWSWTAYYSGVTQNTMLTNAAWLAQNLKSLGYRYFFIDAGYQYATGEYATPNGTTFPRGMAYVGHKVEDHGLTLGLWVAPFEVSDRSWVYEHHKDWLVHNLAGAPIRIVRQSANEYLYALDTTNPGAQDYLRYTYRTLVKDWGVRFIKMDFMGNSAVEGVYYRPNTTALEALHTGLEIIRSTVGKDVVLDKDGGPMLTPVGIVNTGRISQDTGHTFAATHDAATGIAARYYMDRNFYISDPDAFTVSKQIIKGHVWHHNKVPLTLDEAESSIALAAVSGGMFEIGDDLPTLGASPERVALVKNPDLLDMVRLERPSQPLDLMSYRPEDSQPSIFLLKEDPRQQILTVFNWTEQPLSHTLTLAGVGLKTSSAYTATNVLRGGAVPIENGTLTMTLPPHSVRMLKLIDTSVPEAALAFEAHAPATGKAGDLVEFHAAQVSADAPVFQYRWDFGDGVSAEGADVSHAYTFANQFTVKVTAVGLNGRTAQKTLGITITGRIPVNYNPADEVRYTGTN